MNCVGLDPGLSSFGVAIPGRVFTIAAGNRKGADRLANIRREVVHALRSADADLAVIEKLWARNREALRGMAEAVGVVKLACWDLGVAVAEMNPVSLKVFATESGRADKDAMRKAALRIVPFERFSTSDECDAWWLYACGLQIVGRGLFVPSAKQRAALDTIEVSDGVRRRVRMEAAG